MVNWVSGSTRSYSKVLTQMMHIFDADTVFIELNFNQNETNTTTNDNIIKM